MINRRLVHDDRRGVGENLNETDSFERGISVPASFFVQFFNYTREKSQQRWQQLFIDEPLQYHFAFKYEVPPSIVDYTMLEYQNKSAVGDALIHLPLKFQLFPLDRNIIHMRLENIFDNFDVHSPKQPNHTIYIQVRKFAEDLYKYVNGEQAQLNNINILETTLTGNQPYSTWKKNRINWVGKDDATIVEPEYPKDRPDFEVALQPQRIRSFVIEYIPFVPKPAGQSEQGFMQWLYFYSNLTWFILIFHINLTF